MDTDDVDVAIAIALTHLCAASRSLHEYKLALAPIRARVGNRSAYDDLAVLEEMTDGSIDGLTLSANKALAALLLAGERPATGEADGDRWQVFRQTLTDALARVGAVDVPDDI
jgi:hypothetical protein